MHKISTYRKVLDVTIIADPERREVKEVFRVGTPVGGVCGCKGIKNYNR